MQNSRSIDDLRPDVAANCRIWVELCRKAGLDVALSNTLRDNEYQAYLYAQGRTRPGKIVTNSKTTTFHGKGLAIDFYSASSGWSDAQFFRRCAKIAKRVGFSWAGEWKTFVEYCHIQWDNDRRSGHVNAPVMPLYEEEIEMTKAELEAIVDARVRRAIADYEEARAVSLNRPVSSCHREDWEVMTADGIFDGTRPCAPLTREQAATTFRRMGLGKRGV